MLTRQQEDKIQKSPAFKSKSDSYPASWRGKVPASVKMAKDVESDLPHVCHSRIPLVAQKDAEYPVWVNSHGAMAVIFPDGQTLGLKAYEFEITKWHEV